MQATIHGVTISYDLHGTGDPVLLVHGFPLSRKLWEPLVGAMRDDYRLIVPDLRGHGESEASEQASMGQYADDLVALLDEIGEARPVVLVGFSMGGYIAFDLFRRYPERVRALVLVDTRAQADSEEAAKGRHATAAKVLSEGSKVVADAMTPKLFAAAASEALRATWHAAMSATSPQGVAAALRAMAVRPDSTETLATIARPTLVVVGAEDAITPPADARAMHEAIAGSHLETVAGAGHMTPVEQPQRFAALLETFLAGLEQPCG